MAPHLRHHRSKRLKHWTNGKLGDLEQRTFQVLVRLRDEGDEAKQALEEVLSQNSLKQYDSYFANTRESVFQLTKPHSTSCPRRSPLLNLAHPERPLVSLFA
ncbi:hypothetical protein JHK87_055175 [Glycine soja]|nr:hypothetical protein JHK87_055175 [Glycine soja]